VKKKKAARRTMPYLLLAGLLITLAVFIAHVPGASSQDQGNNGVKALDDRIKNMETRYGELLENHPDLPLTAEREFFRAWNGYDPETKEKSRDEMAKMLAALEQAAFSQTCGEIGDPGLAAEIFKYKTFSPNGFKDFLNSHSMPGTVPLTSSPAITAWPEADRRIIRMAVERGYRLRVEANEPLLAGSDQYRLQKPAQAAWFRMKQAAARNGISLGLVSCYRSVDRQREIFTNLLKSRALKALGHKLTEKDILSGKADKIIDGILRESSIPGYSRHHSGYTMDMTDLKMNKDFTFFRQSAGYAWISAHNFTNAKRFGFLPSYPEGASSQGPDPEAWEFTWAGEENLLR
jgi:hypothetical protein